MTSRKLIFADPSDRKKTALDPFASDLGLLVIDIYFSRKGRVIEYLQNFGVKKAEVEELCSKVETEVKNWVSCYVNEYHDYRKEAEPSHNRDFLAQSTKGDVSVHMKDLYKDLLECQYPLSAEDEKRLEEYAFSRIEWEYLRYIELDLEDIEKDLPEELYFIDPWSEPEELDFLFQYCEEKKLPEHVINLLWRLVVSVVFIERCAPYRNKYGPHYDALTQFLEFMVPNVHFPNEKISFEITGRKGAEGREFEGLLLVKRDQNIERWRPLAKRRPRRRTIKENDFCRLVVETATRRHSGSATDLYLTVIDVAEENGRQISYRTAERWVKAYRDSLQEKE